MKTIGIDFGTTKTLVAEWNPSTQRPEPIRLGRGTDELPTAIHVDRNGQFLFGEDAVDQLAINPEGYVTRIKRDLGKDRPPYNLNGRSYHHQELITKFLAEIKRRIEDESTHGVIIEHVVITVPAKYGPAAKEDLRTAAIKAGFSSIEMLEEPVSAGICFLHFKKDTDLGKDIAVFDWGGGTLDIALVENQEGIININRELLEGNNELGGEDIDDNLLQAVNDELRSRNQLPIIKENTSCYPLLIKRLRETKCLLSKKEAHEFQILAGNYNFPFKVDREQFESFIHDTLKSAQESFDKWLKRATELNKIPSNVLLVGGTSQIPAVAKGIEKCGPKALPWTLGKEAVALGAAIHAGRNLKKDEAGSNAIAVKVLNETQKKSEENNEVNNADDTFAGIIILLILVLVIWGVYFLLKPIILMFIDHWILSCLIGWAVFYVISRSLKNK